MILVSLAVLLNRQSFMEAIQTIIHNKMIVVAGFPGTVIGLLIINSYNVWSADWRIIITIIGWMALAKGLACLFFPERVAAMASRMINDKKMNVWGVIVLALGLILAFKGYGF